MSRDVNLLHPKLRALIPILMEKWRAAGLNVLITQTFRTKDEQEALYAQGRTKPGPVVTKARYPYSAHNWGVAFDFCRNAKGREYDDSDGFFRRVAAIAKPYGLSWGGDWTTFVDKPHLELTEFSSIATLIKLYREPKEFILSWGTKPNPEEKEMDRYRTLSDLPERMQYAIPPMLEMMNEGIISGKDKNADLMKREIDMTEDMIRTIIICRRMTPGK